MTTKEMWKATLRGLPKNLSRIQYEEMEKAFYIGVFSILLELARNISLLEEDKGVQALENLHNECESFFKSIGVSLPN